jgi:purine-binding chemotaxis protein CheW
MPAFAADIRLNQWLLCRAGSRLCALSLESVIEVMRRLPIEPLAGSPPFVLGLSIYRGAPVPVIDAASLFAEHAVGSDRLVAIRAGSRTIGLAFTAVIGLGAIEAEAAAALPPLMGEAAGDVITMIATLDAELLHVLNTARMAPDLLLEASVAEKAPL